MSLQHPNHGRAINRSQVHHGLVVEVHGRTPEQTIEFASGAYYSVDKDGGWLADIVCDDGETRVVSLAFLGVTPNGSGVWMTDVYCIEVTADTLAKRSLSRNISN